MSAQFESASPCDRMLRKMWYSRCMQESLFNWMVKQAGTGPNWRHIQGSKIAKRFPSVKYSLLQYSKIENFLKKKFSKNLLKKMDRVAHRGPLARAPGALKGRHFRNGQHFCRSWRADPSEKKQIFEKKSHKAEKLKGGPLGILKTQSVVKYQTNWRGALWREKNFRTKSLTMPKNWKGDPLGFFNVHSVAKHQKIKRGKIFIFGKKSHSAEKNCKGGPFGIFQHPFWRKTAKKLKEGPFGEKKFRKKVSQCRKTMKGGTLCSRPVWYVTRKNRKNLFGSVR